MWATSSTPPAEQNTRRGFTIVELLVVIVVIAILAAIVIVAYNGITQRARVATVSSDLEGAAKQLAIDQTLNSAYPATVAAANNGAGLKASAGTTYQYAVNNAASPQTFCITATNGTTSYYASSTNNVPTAGACIGHSLGGVPLAHNLVTNPSFEVDTTGYSLIAGATINRVTGGLGVVAGNAALEVTATTANQSGAEVSISGLSANTTYTVSGYVTLISGDPTALQMREGDGAGTRASTPIASSLIVGQPVRLSLTWTSSATPAGRAQFWRGGTATSPVTFRLDAVMVEQGSPATAYSEL